MSAAAVQTAAGVRRVPSRVALPGTDVANIMWRTLSLTMCLRGAVSFSQGQTLNTTERKISQVASKLGFVVVVQIDMY